AAMVGGGYDGIWNVLIITQAGNCDPAYSYPFQVSGGRITSASAADVSGTVGRGGGGVGRISAGGARDFPAETAVAAGRPLGADLPRSRHFFSAWSRRRPGPKHWRCLLQKA